MSLEISNTKTIIENNNLERIENLKEKDELELFEDFYKFQNNIGLNDEQKEIIAEVVEQVKNK